MSVYLEDLVLDGEPIVFGSHTFSTAEIKIFAAQFDPQEFHLDEERAKQSMFGGLCASGWHTVAVWVRLWVDYRKDIADEMRARGDRPAIWGPSPGMRDMQWIRPVFAGDTITYSQHKLRLKAIRSRPGYGMLNAENIGINQDGVQVFSVESAIMLERRQPLT